MKLCDDVITVFNAGVDAETGDGVWRGTVLRGVSWHRSDASAVDAARGGLVSASRCVCRIPEGVDADGRTYVDPLAYARAEDPGELWTLAGGDVIVRGEVRGEGWTPALLMKAWPERMCVLSVTDNRRAPRAPHFRVVGT